MIGRLLRRRKSRDTTSSTRDARQRAPLLVLRFAIVTALVVGVAGAAILLVVRGLSVSQAQRQANETSRLVSTTVLAPLLRPSDVRRPVAGTRRAALDRLFRDRLLTADTQVVTLLRSDGLVTYSTNHALIGERHATDLSREASTGRLVSAVVPGGAGAGKVLRTFVPLGVRGEKPAVAVIDRDYGPVAEAAGHVFFPVAAVLEGLLVVLFIAFVPLLRRVSLRIDRQIRQIEHAAFHDDLTGLPNRALFRRHLEVELERATPTGALLVLDVNDFKDVNDTLGHVAGDELLVRIGERLGATLGDDGVLARLGGDEFGVLLPRESADAAHAIAVRLLGAFGEPVVAGGLPLAVDASIGLAVWPEDGGDAGTLLQHVDVAMYRAKELRSGVAAYDDSFDENDPERLGLFADFRAAVVARVRSPCTTSPRRRSRTTRSSAWRRSSAGSIPSAVSCRPTSSCPWPSAPG